MAVATWQGDERLVPEGMALGVAAKAGIAGPGALTWTSGPDATDRWWKAGLGQAEAVLSRPVQGERAGAGPDQGQHHQCRSSGLPRREDTGQPDMMDGPRDKDRDRNRSRVLQEGDRHRHLKGGEACPHQLRKRGLLGREMEPREGTNLRGTMAISR